MNTQKKVIAILAATFDGDDLHQHQVALCRAALNDAPDDAAATAVDVLHHQLANGKFIGRHNWFHGVRHLVKDSHGYIHWRDRIVEHYSFGDRSDEERAAALELGNACQMLEAKDLPVNGRTVINSETFADAPKGTPWLAALTSYYCFYDDAQGKPAGVILGLPDHAAVAVEVHGATTTLRYAEADDLSFGTYKMFHELQDEGYKPCTPKDLSYAGLVGMFTDLGLSPSQVDGIINLGCPQTEELSSAERI